MDVPVTLAVEIWYSSEAGIGPVASGTRGMDPDMNKKFRQDISSLTIPPPRSDATSCPRPNVIETYWETTEHAPHRKNVETRFTVGAERMRSVLYNSQPPIDKVVYRLLRRHDGEEICRHEIEHPRLSSSRNQWPVTNPLVQRLDRRDDSVNFQPPPILAPAAFRHGSVPPQAPAGPRALYTQHSPSTSLGKRPSIDDSSPEAKRSRYDNYPPHSSGSNPTGPSLYKNDPPRNPTSEDRDPNVLRSRCEDLERKLEASNRHNAILEARNKELEMLIRDVERECRQPFVVPLLLDAFVEVSKLSDKATNTPL